MGCAGVYDFPRFWLQCLSSWLCCLSTFSPILLAIMTQPLKTRTQNSASLMMSSLGWTVSNFPLRNHSSLLKYIACMYHCALFGRWGLRSLQVWSLVSIHYGSLSMKWALGGGWVWVRSEKSLSDWFSVRSLQCDSIGGHADLHMSMRCLVCHLSCCNVSSTFQLPGSSLLPKPYSPYQVNLNSLVALVNTPAWDNYHYISQVCCWNFSCGHSMWVGHF